MLKITIASIQMSIPLTCFVWVVFWMQLCLRSSFQYFYLFSLVDCNNKETTVIKVIEHGFEGAIKVASVS